MNKVNNLLNIIKEEENADSFKDLSEGMKSDINDLNSQLASIIGLPVSLKYSDTSRDKYIGFSQSIDTKSLGMFGKVVESCSLELSGQYTEKDGGYIWCQLSVDYQHGNLASGGSNGKTMDSLHIIYNKKDGYKVTKR